MVAFCLAGETNWFAATAGESPPANENHLATRLCGMTVQNYEGQDLGTVRDFIIDRQSDQIRYAVFSSAGGLGFGSPAKVVPARALSTATAKKRTLALDVSVSGWEHAPLFRSQDLAAVRDPAEARRIDEFYGQTGHAPSLAGGGAPTGSPAQLAPTGRQTSATVKPPEAAGRLELASDLLGKRVTSVGHAGLGKVVDLLVDLSGKLPVLAIISTQRLFEPRHMMIVPLKYLSLVPSGGLMFDANPTVLEHLRSFDSTAWEEANGPKAAIYHYDENYNLTSFSNGAAIER